MNIYEKLLAIQTELKAPKSKYNSFGKYNYRSLEDICESVKPLLKKYNCTLFLQDEIDHIGDRYYVTATASFVDFEDSTTVIEVCAKAREADDKKGQDDSQVTGTASSYARKYCLNGLFLIDDTKDADTDEYQNERRSRVKKPDNAEGYPTPDEKKLLIAECKKKGVDVKSLLDEVGVDKVMTSDQYKRCLEILKEKYE